MPTLENVSKLNGFENLTLDELLVLNNAICDLITRKRTEECSKRVAVLAPGDKVHCKGWGKTAPFNAVVEKVLRVNVDLVDMTGKKWRVSANLLSKI